MKPDELTLVKLLANYDKINKNRRIRKYFIKELHKYFKKNNIYVN